ncbi:MAG: hypothetical protein HXY20_01165 [Acidobacteria bacterium]|nr:hypothetical protein [Acidobacteriota bacterium]
MKHHRTAVILVLLASIPLLASYKTRPWKPRPAEDYPARLTSEGVTIAAEPLYRDDLAALVFDKKDIVTRGIIPLAVAVFNDNDFPVQVVAETVELTGEGERQRTLLPGEAVARIFQKSGKSFGFPLPIPKISIPGDPRYLPLQDFEHKFLKGKVIQPHQAGGGFLFFQKPAADVRSFLSAARLYIPDIVREDDGTRMIFFEIDLKPTIDQPSATRRP